MPLAGYFDDSGTHDDSDVVLWGGFVGQEDDWRSLEPEWNARLRVDGINAFHMKDCAGEIGRGAFADMDYASRQNLIHDLRNIILAQPVRYRLWR